MSEKRLNWKQIGCEGDQPAARSGHSLTIEGKKAFLFGGTDKKPRGTAPGPTNELFVLDMGMGSSEDMKWKWSKAEATCEDEPPAARWKHSATALGRGKVCNARPLISGLSPLPICMYTLAVPCLTLICGRSSTSVATTTTNAA
jgi:hypothetical protein